MAFKDFCILVLWTKVALALEGLRTVHATAGTYNLNQQTCFLEGSNTLTAGSPDQPHTLYVVEGKHRDYHSHTLFSQN